MVILQHLWIVVSNHFLIKCIILVIKFILARKSHIFLSSFHWSSWFANSITTSEISFFCISTYFITCRLSSFFPFFHLRTKFPVNRDRMLCICISVNAVVHLYIGQTRRHIHTRISEHMSVSPLTGKKRSVSTLSGILAYIHITKHQISPSS